MKKSSVTFKTLMYLISFCVVIVLFLWFIQIEFLQISYEFYQTDNINKIAKDIKNNEEEVISSLEDIAYKNNICIEYYSSSGSLGFNTKNSGCLLNSRNRTIKKAKSDLIVNKVDYVKIISPEDGFKSVLYKIPLKNGAFIFLNTPLEDINTTTKLLKTQLKYILVVLLLLAIIVAFIISRMINKPILEITSKARELGKGNYDIDFGKYDISELDELSSVLTVAATEMNKTDSLKKDLIANVSHDLKTPLTMIKAYAEKIKDISYKNKDKMDKDLNIIISETDRLNVLVNDLLSLNKLEKNVEALNLTKYDLVEDIKEIVNRYDILKEEGYKFTLDLPEVAIVEADKSKMDQVIYNLINNAVEHTGDNLDVKIEVKQSWGYYIVNIIDFGKGIPENEIPLVWNKYYKKEKNHKRNVIGSGIGLSIVREVLEKHNFEYGIDSKLNNYTNFYFKIKKVNKL